MGQIGREGGAEPTFGETESGARATCENGVMNMCPNFWWVAIAVPCISAAGVAGCASSTGLDGDAALGASESGESGGASSYGTLGGQTNSVARGGASGVGGGRVGTGGDARNTPAGVGGSSETSPSSNPQSGGSSGRDAPSAGVGGRVSGSGGRAANAGGASDAGRGDAGGAVGLGGGLQRGGAGGRAVGTGGRAGVGGQVVPGAGGASSGAGGAPSQAGGARASGGSSAPDTTPASDAGAAAAGACPAGITKTISVAKDGSGDYSTVQAAIDSIKSGSTTPTRIDIKAGTYTEKLTIADRTNLCLVGAEATTTILTYRDANATVGSTYGSASVFVSANDFSAANLTFQNTYGAGSQAVALRTTGQRQQFRNCRMVGYQDTLYTHSGTQYFRDCYVQGNTDFVFGGATAILENCEVRNVASGSAVAAPNTEASKAYGIVFLGGTFTAASGVSGVALGRPWGADGAAAYLRATLGSHIRKEGFVVMSGNDPANARFGEFESKGAGANASSRSSYQLSASEAQNYTVAKIFGNSWVPSYSQ